MSHQTVLFTGLQNCPIFGHHLHNQHRHYHHQPYRRLVSKKSLYYYRNYSQSIQTLKLKHKPLKVSVIGAGSWGTAISKIIATNVIKYPELFDDQIILYVRNENLRLVIEKTRINIKYLRQAKLPMNIMPVSNLDEAASKSDIFIFAIPHEYIQHVCCNINTSCFQDKNNDVFGISLTKGLHIDSTGNLVLTSQVIERMLKMPVGVLSGANVALDVANEQFTEATLSPPPTTESKDDILKCLFQNDYFRVSLCRDKPTVEICGALKNVISCGAGIIDGLGFGVNTKAATIRCGIYEAIKFTQLFHPQCQVSTFLENCGIADVIASSFGGRNRKVFEAFVKNKKSLAELENELLLGQKLQGPGTAKVVYQLLRHRKILDQFPLFTAIYDICEGQAEPLSIIDTLRKFS